MTCEKREVPMLEELLANAVGENCGIVLRYIPKTRIGIYEARHYRGEPNQELFHHEQYGRQMMKEIKENSHGGKWLAMRSDDSSATTHWSKSQYVIADTPEAAVQALLDKEAQ